MNPAPAFERHFLRFLSRFNPDMSAQTKSLISRLTQASINQHSCLALTEDESQLLAAPDNASLMGRPGENTPFILSHQKLYLARYYHYEAEVAAMVAQRNHHSPIAAADWLKEKLDRYFGDSAGNRQKLAALMAVSRGLAIITGGPGTGKTSTVAKILRIIHEAQPAYRIRVAAPTGKAAMRLAESLAASNDAAVAELSVTTLHRLLGMRADGRSWRHGPDYLISADLLIVDEASMIDLPMMHRLLRALPAETRLILLGDPNQLPSVDTGNVLADLCAETPGYSDDFRQYAEPLLGKLPLSGNASQLENAICELDTSYRFDPASGIGRVAAAIKVGESLPEPDHQSFALLPLPDAEAKPDLLTHWPAYRAALQDPDASAATLLNGFEQTRILCCRRGGPLGVSNINLLIENQLEVMGHKTVGESFYPGRPILITRNDYNLGLFNGDIGICVSTGPDQQYQVVFDQTGEKTCLATRLPQHETCFAMTVHKSQGSEFAQVLLIVDEEPSTQAGNLLSRELLYTAVTRARDTIMIACEPPIWNAAVGRSAARTSGMTDFLAKPAPATIHQDS